MARRCQRCHREGLSIRRSTLRWRITQLLSPRRKKTDDMTLVPWKRGKSLVWDSTCADTFAPSHLPYTVRHKGAPANMAEDTKKRKHAFFQDRFPLCPLQWRQRLLVKRGTFPHQIYLSKDCCKSRPAQRLHPPTPTLLLRKLIVANQRRNVASILGTLPTGK